MLLSVDFRVEQMKRQLRLWGHPLGSKISAVRSRTHVWAKGQVIFCSSCGKVVGFWMPFDGEKQEHLLDPAAGWVLERRISRDSYWLCGAVASTCDHCHGAAAGCQLVIDWQNPLACSDECEQQILQDQRFEHCEPPFGYQRGGPHT